MKFIATILFQVILLSLFAQDDISCHHFDEKGRIREHIVDFESLVLNIDFSTKEKKVFGEVSFVFKPMRKEIKTLVLDAPDIIVESVLLDGKVCEFSSTETDLIIEFSETLYWEENHELEIKYEAQPEKGLYFLGWDDETNRARKQIWTQGQGIDNRYWIPSYDDMNDKLLTETFITFEDGFEVISNGDFMEKTTNDNGTSTWHYKMQKPHVVYLIMIAIGEFDYKDMVSKSGVVSRQYYYPDRPQDFGPSYQYSIEMMDWMEKEFGVDYPWGKIYRNVPVADFLYGAMENTTSTIFTDYYMQDSRAALERNYIGTNAHELTHQWFGDLITEWSGTHHWLHESFATHYAKHFKKAVLGDDLYEWDRYLEMQSSLRADDKNDLPVAHVEAGSSRHYPKGSIVIDMLRYVVGEEQYNKVISKYLTKYSFKLVDTHLFQLEFAETLGLNLDWFFDQWILRGGYPHYEVSYKNLTNKIELSVNQIQEIRSTVGYFKMPINIEIAYSDGTKSVEQIQVDSTNHVFVLEKEEGKEMDYIIFDPGNKIYKKIDFKRTAEELILQAKNATNLIDRYLALRELQDVELSEKRKDLWAIYWQEEFYLPKANIIKQLADDDHKKSKNLILEALSDSDMEVRRACIDFVEEIDKSQLSAFENLLKDSSYVTIEKTLRKLEEQYPENSKRYLELTKIDAEKNSSLKITWLDIASKEDEKYVDELIDLTSQSFEFRTRIKAMYVLDDQENISEAYLLNLLDATKNFNRRMANVAKKSLTAKAKDAQLKTQILSLIEGLDLDKNEQKRIDALKDKL